MWKELIGRPLTADERIAIITATFSDPDETKKVGHIHKGYAQTLVDVIDEVFHLVFYLNGLPRTIPPCRRRTPSLHRSGRGP